MELKRLRLKMGIFYNSIIAIIIITNSLFFIEPKIYDIVNAQTVVEDEIIENTLEQVVEEATQGTKEAEDQTVVVNETSSSNIEQLKPVSDEMLKYAEEIFPALNAPTLSHEDKVKILNQIFTDPESFLQNWRNLRDSIDSLECTVNKESGVFNKTFDCTNWSAAENAKNE